MTVDTVETAVTTVVQADTAKVETVVKADEATAHSWIADELAKVKAFFAKLEGHLKI